MNKSPVQKPGRAVCTVPGLTPEQSSRIISCAKTYETELFYRNKDGTARDPAFFMHQYTDSSDQECAALIASSLAFGSRTQILRAAERIFNNAAASGKTLSSWIKTDGWTDLFPEGKSGQYYRTFSNKCMRSFFISLSHILTNDGSLGSYFQNTCGSSGNLIQAVINAFPDASPLIPKNMDSACKRICLFLRWMVRSGPVDLGLWNWYSPSKLCIPVDTHVLSSARKLGIITCRGTPGSTAAVACRITDAMRNLWPDDPCCADYALFGVDEENKKSDQSTFPN